MRIVCFVSLLLLGSDVSGRIIAKVAELVDALALGASGVTRESSSLSFRTNQHYAVDAATLSPISAAYHSG